MSLTVESFNCLVALFLITCITRNQNPGENNTREGLKNTTVVHTVTHLVLTTWFAKTGIREVRGRGFRPLGSGP